MLLVFQYGQSEVTALLYTTSSEFLMVEHFLVGLFILQLARAPHNPRIFFLSHKSN